METIAYDYFKFAKKVDSGEVDIFNIDQENENIRGNAQKRARPEYYILNNSSWRTG